MSEYKTITSGDLANLLKPKKKVDGEATSNNRSEETESTSSNSVSQKETEVVQNDAATTAENEKVESVETEKSETSDENVVVDDQENEESVWFKDDELGIIYKDEENAKRGLKEKEKYIRKILEEREKLAEERNRYAQEREELLRQLESQNLDADTVRERKIKEKLPEEYRDLSEDDFIDPDELKDFLVAKAKAEAAVDLEVEKAKVEKEKQLEAARQKRQQAIDYVKEKMKGFDAKNTEDKLALQELLEKEESGYTATDLMVMAHEVSPYFADLIYQGLQSMYRNGRQVEVAKTVKETKTNVLVPAETPNKTKITPQFKDAKDQLRYFLKNQK